jgi:uncharacterized repeat protein (TIGR01451 family)
MTKLSHDAQNTPKLNSLSLVVGSLLLIQMNPVLADTGRGIIDIENMAEASYGIEGQAENTEHTQSNIVNAKAFSLPQYNITLTQPLTITLKPGNEVQWQNTLENTGAYDETVAVNFQVPSTLSNFEVYMDDNDNGVIDANDAKLTPTITIKAGEQIHLIVKALTSSNLQDGDKIAVPIVAVVQEDKTVTAKVTDDLVAILPAISYKNASYDKTLAQTQAGQPVYIEVGLALCNADPAQIDNVWINVTSKKTGDIIKLKAVETGVNTGKYRITAPTELNANAIADSIIQTLDADTLEAQATQCESSNGKIVSVISNKILSSIIINNDRPALSVSKEASVSQAQVGDFVEYSINVKNVGKSEATNVVLKDDLPLGFTYVKNSVNVDGKKYDQDFVNVGKYMTLGLGKLNANESRKITYRVVIGATGTSGNGTNTAFAEGEDTSASINITSALAKAHVKVTNGLLNTDGIIIGKVYADFNRDGIQQKDQNELGVAGVRLYLEDGTFVVTDSEGKYSLYGINAKTHVIKLDRTTLPHGVELIEQTNRNAGDPSSRFVDLKHGELHRADFAITDGIDDNDGQGSPKLVKVLQERAKLVVSGNDALEQAIKSDLTLEPVNSIDSADNVEAAGCKNATKIDGQINCESVIPDHTTSQTTVAKIAVHPVAPVKTPEIEKALSTTDDKRIAGVTAEADFLNLTDQQRVDSLKIRVQIKAPKGATTQLLVNNTPVDKQLMGKEVAWDKECISGFDYFAVPLITGKNTLTIRSTDSNNKLVSTKSITLIAPQSVSSIVTRSQPQSVPADGVSEYQVVVSLKDVDNGLYVAPTTVSLDTNIGTIDLKDNDSGQAGVQTTINGGELLVSIKAPNNPGKGNLLVKAGNLEKVIPLQFTPTLRPMIASGIIEGTVALQHSGSKLESVSKDDGFEEELQTLSGNQGDNTTTHGRAAFFLKGKVRGDMLLTMAYDSDKHKQDHLFRDIDPESYYPVYGDASAKGFEAQSSEKLYVRLDKGRSFAVYGDLKTHIDNNEGLSLGQYDRTLTGLKAHYETDKTKVTAYAAQAHSHQQVTETRGLGISGPYPTGVDFDQILLNSETVEVITRYRNNPGVILSRQVLARYSDYEFDSVSHAIYLRSPIASMDIDGNPIYLRITVETDNVGDNYIVAGTAGNYQLTKRLNLGASYAQSDDPTNHEKLSSINGVMNVTDNLKLIAEMAHYDADKATNIATSQINAGLATGDKSGNADRLELTYKTQDNDARIYYNKAEAGFAPALSLIHI